MNRFFSLAVPLYFSPYLAVYLFGLAANVRTASLLLAFRALHGLWFGLAVFFFVRARRNLRPSTCFWTITAFLVFWIPGVYLEYPADPWAHLDVIHSWDRMLLVRDSPWWSRFGYFYAWTWLRDLSPLHVRHGLHLYSAFTQSLLALQVYALARTLKFSTSWAGVQTLGFFILFGTGPFSFRTYALAPSLLSQIGVFATVALLIRSFDCERRFALLALPLPLLLIGLNHPQGFIFLLPSLLAVALWLYRARAGSKWPRVFGGLLLLAVVERVVSHYLLTTPAAVPDSYRGLLGSFHFFDDRLRLLSTLGGPGVLGLIAAVVLFAELPLLSLLTILPVAFLLYSPTATFLARVLPDPHVVYRILYAFPPSFILLEAVRRLCVRYGLAVRWLPVAVGAAAVVLSLSARGPWFGRFYFQVHRPDPALSYQSIDATAQWLVDNGWHERTIQRGRNVRLLWTDNVTAFLLEAHLAISLGGDRREAMGKVRPLRFQAAEATKIILSPPYEAALLAEPDKVPPLPRSWVAAVSKHWGPEIQDMHDAIKENPAIGEALLRAGWKKTPVPPYYQLYERPL